MIQVFVSDGVLRECPKIPYRAIATQTTLMDRNVLKCHGMVTPCLHTRVLRFRGHLQNPNNSIYLKI